MNPGVFDDGAVVLLGALRIGSVQFASPVWLWLIPILGALVIWIGRKSLSGMGMGLRRVALAIRLFVIILLASAMAEPSWQDESEDVDTIAILDVSKSIPQSLQQKVETFVQEAASLSKSRQTDDEFGVMTTARLPIVHILPRKDATVEKDDFLGPTDATDLASSVRLALAVRSEDAAFRILLATDGNETMGSLFEAAETARAAGVPIDVLPLRYSFDSEVIVDRIVVPATARMGETINIRPILTATKPTRGLLTILEDNEPIDLDPDSPTHGIIVDLEAGTNPLSVPIIVSRAGAHEYKTIFEPIEDDSGNIGDSILENNQSMAVTFISSDGRVLVIAEDPAEAAPLMEMFTHAKLHAKRSTADAAFGSLTELSSYDAVVLINEPAYNFTQQQQEELRQFVHDGGGGLMVIGGPESFGAGGWIGSPLEEALPLKLDPPQKRQMPRGALALVMHSIEMPNGVYYGKQVAKAAIDALSRLDYAGIVEYDWNAGGQGASWVHPMSLIGERGAVYQSIENLTFGDMPDFAPSLQLALKGLKSVDAGQRHVIMISDGDPSPPSRALVQAYRDAGVSISTVGVFPHSGMDTGRMKRISEATGGRHYAVNTNAGLANLPQIFIKEAQTVKRKLIWEGDPFTPAPTGIPVEGMRGIASVPPLSGYVVTADRGGLSMVTLRGKEEDPILAQWQHGLGRVVAFTSDSATRWCPDWVSWGQYQAFWEQHARWVMRPSGSSNVRVETETDGEETHIIIEAFDDRNERLNFADFQARVARPDGKGQAVVLRQVGPGEYRATIPTEVAGSYVLSLRYAVPDESGDVVEGSVQAAVTRPFADEFRALEDNYALLAQIAEITGGRVFNAADPEKADLFDRTDLVMPVASTPIWTGTALLGLAIFLLDVAVRRVRIDLALIAAGFRRAVSKSRGKAGEQMDSLREARDKAKHRMEAQSGPVEAADAPKPKETAKVKFEATPEQLSAKPDSPLSTDAPPPIERVSPKADKPSAGDEEGMSRLLKAKRRARDEMEQDE